MSHNFFYLFLDCSFCLSLSPYLSYTASHILPVDAASLSLYLHPLLPPHISRARSYRPPGRLPCLPASTARLQFPPLMVNPRSYSRDPVSTFPSLVAPPFMSSTFKISSLSDPGFSLPAVSYFLCLPPPSASPPPSPLPADLTRRTITLSVQGGDVVFFVGGGDP